MCFSKRFVIEIGLGADFHGQDVNRAAEKAVTDADDSVEVTIACIEIGIKR